MCGAAQGFRWSVRWGGHQGHAGGFVEGGGEFVEEVEESGALGGVEGGHEAIHGVGRGPGEGCDQGVTAVGEGKGAAAFVGGADDADDEAGGFERGEDHADGGAVEAQEAGEGDLVEAGAALEADQDAVLGGRDAVGGGCFHEDGDGDLVGAAEHKAGAGAEGGDGVCYTVGHEIVRRLIILDGGFGVWKGCRQR